MQLKKIKPRNVINVRVFPAINPVAHKPKRCCQPESVCDSSVRKLCLFSLDGLFNSTDTAEKESALLKGKVILMIGSVH